MRSLTAGPAEFRQQIGDIAFAARARRRCEQDRDHDRPDFLHENASDRRQCESFLLIRLFVASQNGGFPLLLIAAPEARMIFT
jgi:hypothetical protein